MSLPQAPYASARPHPASAADSSQLWDPQGPYSLRQTLTPVVHQAGPGGAFVDGSAWLAFTTPEGPVTLRLTEVQMTEAAGAGLRIQAQAWGPGAVVAGGGIPALLGALDTPDSLDHSGTELPELAREGRRRARGMRLPRTGRILDALIPAILEQKVTTIEARRGYRYLVQRFGTAAPGPDAPPQLRVAPKPEVWARIPSWEWHKAGVGPQRSATVMRAVKVASGLERAALDTPETAASKLQSVSGIGAWTAAEVLQRSHGSADHISVGDYHLAAYVGYALTGQKTDDAGMIELLKPWAGQRQRLVRYLYASGFSKPKFGPRMTIQDHRGH